MRRTLLAVALGAAFFAVGATSSGASQQATAASRPQIMGAGPAEARLLRDVLRTVSPSRISSVAFVKGPARMGGELLPKGLLGLRILNDPGPRGAWEAQMVTDLYGVAASRLGLPHVDLVVAANERLTIHDIGTHERTPASLATVRDTLELTGIRVVELRRVSGDLALTIQADHPLSFVTSNLRTVLTAAEKVSLDELYVGVENSTGATVYAVAHSSNWGELKAASDNYLACGPVNVISPAPLAACHG